MDRDFLQQRLPDWVFNDTETTSGGAEAAWERRAETTISAPETIPGTGQAGLIVLTYADPEVMDSAIPHETDVTLQEIFTSLPPFLKPGDPDISRTYIGDFPVTSIMVPLSIAEVPEADDQSMITGALILQDTTKLYVIYAARFANAEVLSEQVAEWLAKTSKRTAHE